MAEAGFIDVALLRNHKCPSIDKINLNPPVTPACWIILVSWNHYGACYAIISIELWFIS